MLIIDQSFSTGRKKLQEERVMILFKLAVGVVDAAFIFIISGQYFLHIFSLFLCTTTTI